MAAPGLRHLVGAKDRRAGAVSRECDPDITRRLSALPEDRVLDFFWLMVRHGVERLGLLLQLTEVVIDRPATWNAAAIRDAHERQDSTGTIQLTRTACFACDGVGPLFRHHIVEVHHGGSNVARNQVVLCFPCHQYLHPWLKDAPYRPSATGLESLGDVMARVLDPTDHAVRED